MARVCTVNTLRPSSTSKLNLRAVAQHLQRYSASVLAVRQDSEEEETQESPRHVSHCSGQTEIRIVSKQVIKIDSESDESSVTSSPLGDDEVWADAFEYQEAYELSSRLSQDKSSHNKENREPDAARSSLPSKSNSNGDAVSEKKSPAQDFFACFDRPYKDLPKPPKHKALKKEEYFTLHNNPTRGRTPVVIYVTNEFQLDQVLRLLQPPILSLDMEWIARSRKKQISLIQLSDAHTVLLIQISQFKSFPQKLKELIEDPKWIKCGVSIMAADASRLRDVYQVLPQGICELSYFARLVDRSVHGPENRLIALSKLANHYLGAPLAKGDVRCSNWSQIPLSKEQREYAASDAYAGYLIFSQLERLRQMQPEMRNIWPPVRACPPAPWSKASSTSSLPQNIAKATHSSSSTMRSKSATGASTFAHVPRRSVSTIAEAEAASREASTFAMPRKVKATRPRSLEVPSSSKTKRTVRRF